MWKVTLKGLLGHKIRFVLTALAVTLGVAFMAGTLVLTDTIKVIFDDLVTSVTDGTDAYVRSRDVIDTAFGEQRDRVDASLLPKVRRIDGVQQADGVLQFYAQVVGPDGKAIGDPQGGAPTLGLIWNPGDLSAWRIADGRGPRDNDEVVIDRATAPDPRHRYPHAGVLAYDLRKVAFAMGVGDGRAFLRSALFEMTEGLLPDHDTDH